jgi:hypothetical protein
MQAGHQDLNVRQGQHASAPALTFDHIPECVTQQAACLVVMVVVTSGEGGGSQISVTFATQTHVSVVIKWI